MCMLGSLSMRRFLVMPEEIMKACHACYSVFSRGCCQPCGVAQGLSMQLCLTQLQPVCMRGVQELLHGHCLVLVTVHGHVEQVMLLLTSLAGRSLLPQLGPHGTVSSCMV